MKITLFTISLIISIISSSQNYLSNIWYFGGYDGYGVVNNSGIDFNNLPVTNSDVLAGTGTAGMSTQEGCASICNSNGDLIFYTDGDKIWDKSHVVVASNCGGHYSSTQSAIIVPTPGNTSQFHVFTVGSANFTGGDRTLNYLIVDVNNATAEITSISNVTNLLNDVTEKITAVKHSNGIDYWIVGHLCGTTDFDLDRYNFFTCELKSTGLDLATYATQYITDGGTEHKETASLIGNIGYMKASQDGGMLAVANSSANILDIYDFDNSNGTITYVEQATFNSVYGVEFSPNATSSAGVRTGYLYASGLDFGGTSQIMRITLSAPMSAIYMTASTGTGTTDVENFYAALQLAPDHKIYIAKCNVDAWGFADSGSGCLARINDPNGGTGLVDNDIDLGSADACWAGLPTLVSDFIILPVELIDFKAQYNNSSVYLSWSTATEKNNDYFEIQRSTDAVNYKVIGELAGNGNSNSISEYNFTDYNIDNSQTYYYKLKQVDFDDKYEYSNVISISSKKEEYPEISIYPNPAQNSFIIESSNLENMNCRIFNNIGQLIRQSEIYNSKNKISTESWEKGIYYIQITTNQETITRKIVLK